VRTALVVVVSVLATGCVTAQLHRLDPVVRPARVAAEVAVLDAVPDRPHQLIARVEFRSATVFTSFADLRQRIVAQAAQLGADAIVVGPGSTNTEFIFLPTGMVPSERRTLAAEIIVFR
jgi:hypothetical protein